MRHDKSVVFRRISLGALLLDLFIVRFAFPQTSFFQGKTVTILESSGPVSYTHLTLPTIYSV